MKLCAVGRVSGTEGMNMIELYAVGSIFGIVGMVGVTCKGQRYLYLT